MVRRTLITGASGLAGRALVACLAPSRPLRALIDRTRIATSIETIHGDLLDEAALAEAVRGVDAVVHAAALMEGSDDRLWRTNHDGTRALALAARDAGVTRFVFLSTGLVYRPGPMIAGSESHPVGPRDAYGHTKLAAENALREILGHGVTILRLPSLYDGALCPFMVQLATTIRDVELPWVPPHDPPIELLHVNDLARAIERALDVPSAGGTFNLGGVDLPTYRSLFTTAAAELPFEPRWVHVHASADDPLASADLEPFPLLLREAATIPRTLSSRRAQEVLGYAPTCDWREEIPRSMRIIVAQARS